MSASDKTTDALVNLSRLVTATYLDIMTTKGIDQELVGRYCFIPYLHVDSNLHRRVSSRRPRSAYLTYRPNLPDHGRDIEQYNHAHFDALVREIARLHDVEMAEANATIDQAGQQPEVYLILDTNVLLQHLDIVSQFLDDIEAQVLPLMVIIPRPVLSELDSQKSRTDLAWFARRATAWILKKTKERKNLRGQRQNEVLETPKEGGERLNDLLIADCAQYFAQRLPGSTFLCSADKNLCIECEFRDIRTVLAAQGEWSSRDIMRAMFPGLPQLEKFAAHRRMYRPAAKIAQPTELASKPAQVQVQGMDVDDDDSTTEVILPSHALDSLHMQIIEHFRPLLQDLAFRNGAPSQAQASTGTIRSAHAPVFMSKDCWSWSATDALEFFNAKRPLPPSTPRLDVFMCVPYTARGARRGQDWPRQAWEAVLVALAKFGQDWGDTAIVESVSVLPFHLQQIFMTPMRPTGM